MLFVKGSGVVGGFCNAFSRPFMMSEYWIFCPPMFMKSLSICWMISGGDFLLLFVAVSLSLNLTLRFVLGRVGSELFAFEFFPVRLM